MTWKPRFRAFFWYKVLLILTMQCDECFGQDACKGVALREFILDCSIDSMPWMNVCCRESFGLSFDAVVDTSFVEKFYVLGLGLDSDIWEPVQSLKISQNKNIHGFKKCWKVSVLMYSLVNLSGRVLRMCEWKIARFLLWTLNQSWQLNMDSYIIALGNWFLVLCVFILWIIGKPKTMFKFVKGSGISSFDSWWFAGIWRQIQSFQNKLELLGYLVWSLLFQNVKLCFAEVISCDILKTRFNAIQLRWTASKVAVDYYTPFDKFSILESKSMWS